MIYISITLQHSSLFDFLKFSSKFNVIFKVNLKVIIFSLHISSLLRGDIETNPGRNKKY